MRRVTVRSVIIVLSCIIPLSLALLILGLPSSFAQDPPIGAQGPPKEVVPPHMDYQVPPDANEFSDFVPPGLGTVQMVFIPNQTLVTPPIGANGVAVGMGNELGIIVEEDTFSQPTQIRLSELDVMSPLISATNTISSPIKDQRLLQFTLEAETASLGNAVGVFVKPVRLVVDLRALTTDLNPVLSDFYLAYRDEEDPSIWHEVPTRLHQPGGLISAEVMHFSEWASGVRPERWNPTWHPPTVDLFSGAATFAYPIQVPPGRNGMQPNVSLSYNSNALNGRIHDVDPGPVANGWSLAEISVVRVGVKLEYNNDVPRTHHPDKFRLVFNGSGSELVMETGASSTDNTLRYYVKDRPELRVTRYYDSSLPDHDGLYWIVESPEGTKYRLGYTSDSHEYQKVNNNYHIFIEGHPGKTTTLRESGIAWHVDTATDTFGNQMQYDYNTKEVVEEIDYDGGIMILKTYENRIVEINYNYGERYSGSLPVPKDVDRPEDIVGNTAATTVTFHAQDEDQEPTDPIRSIYVFHNDSDPMAEYRLDIEGVAVDSLGGASGCYNGDTSQPMKTETWVLNSIQLWTDTDADPDTPDGGYPLPSMEFGYDPLPNFHKSMNECFRFQRLITYTNGYGGSMQYSYENDGDGDDVRGRAIGVFSRTGSLNFIWPDIGYSWHISRVTSSDGRNPDVIVDYTFEKPCYDQWSENLEGEWGVMANAERCASGDAPEYGSSVGFEWATQTFYDYQSNEIRTEKTTFYRYDDYLGRVNEHEVYDADDNLISASVTPYTTTVNGSTTFAYASRIRSSDYNSGSGPGITTTQVYGYEEDLQDEDQYGNQTIVWDYGDQAVTGDETTTIRCFYPNVTGGHWVVNKLAVERVFDGIDETLSESMCDWDYDTDLLYETRYRYDGYEYESAHPEQGALTKMKVGAYNQDLGGGPNGVITTTVMTYDDYGNVETTTDAAGATTTIEYETDYYLYPITVTNDLDHETVFEIYGFDGVSLSPDFADARRQAGLLRKATDPNGVEVLYEYDPFGRLFNTYDSGSDMGDLDDRWDGNTRMRYRYWDNSWNQGSVQWLDPENDEPFVILERARPSIYTIALNDYEFTTLTYYDGFGRPIQQQELTAEVDGETYRRDIIVTTSYNAKGKVGCVTVPRDVQNFDDRVDWPTETTFIDDNCESLDHTSTMYDDIGRPLVITAPSGAETTTIYDIVNNTTVGDVSVLHRVRTDDANDHRTNYFYDSRGRLVKVREHTGTVSGGLTNYADTEYTYDWQGSLTKVENREPHQTGGGDLLSTITMTYDVLGRKTAMNDADMGYWVYEYDAAGNMIRQEDALEQVICLYYDALDRPERKIEDDSPGTECPALASAPANGQYHLASYEYDTATNGLGKPAEVSWGPYPDDNNDVFYYDSRGRITTQTRKLDDWEYTMATTSYDSLDRPLTVEYPDGEEITYTYDREGAESLALAAYNLVNFMKYNERGQLSRILRAVSVHSEYDYYAMTGGSGTGNNDGRLETLQHGTTSDNLPDFTYEYDPIGNITEIYTEWTDGGSKTDTQTFEYDSLDRLDVASSAGASIASYNHEYTYNEIGNLTQRKEGSTNFNYSYPTGTPPNQPHAVSSVTNPYTGKGTGSPTSVYSFEYDTNGNMLERVDELADNEYTQEFDIQNRLVEVNQSDSDLDVEFYYSDGEMRAVAVEEIPADTRITTYYPFPGYEEEVRQEWRFVYVGPFQGEWRWVTVATIQRSTYSLAGQTIAVQVTDHPDSDNNGIFYVLADHLGSTTMLLYGPDFPPLTRGDKVPDSEAYYLPYGGYRDEPESGEITDRGFTGHFQQNDLELIYMQARFYVPYINRFISADTIVPDPSSPQSFNRYSYALNNPTNYTDPSGHCIFGGIDTLICGVALAALVTYEVVDNALQNNYLLDDAIEDLSYSVSGAWNDLTTWLVDDNEDADTDKQNPLLSLAGNTASSPGDFDPRDDDRLQDQLQILDEFDMNISEGNCTRCANITKNAFEDAGQSARILRIRGLQNLRYLNVIHEGNEVTLSTRVLGRTPYHDFTVSNGMVYDTLTGSSGMPMERYWNTFFQELYELELIELLPF